MTFYKATRPDGTDFHTSIVLYEVGSTVTHPSPHKRDASGYLSMSTVPTDCAGCEWPLRLFEVEADNVWTDRSYPSKRCTHSLDVVREIDATLALGPQRTEVAALIERCKTLTRGELRDLYAALEATREATRDAALEATRDVAWEATRDAAWEAAGYAAGDAARDAARTAAWEAAGYAAGDSAWDAAGALVCRDLIGTGFTQAHYDLFTGPWRKAVGPIHPDDPDLREES